MRTKITTLIFLSFGFFFLGGCQNQHSKDLSSANEEPPVFFPNKPSNDGRGPLELKLKSVGLPEPHQYKVILEWRAPNLEPSVFFIVKRSDWNEGRVVQGGQSFYQDEEIVEGQKYNYQVQMINGPKTGLSDWAEILVPRDKVFQKKEEIISGKINEYDRIFLKNKPRLYWLGEKLEITTRTIISDGGVLEAFPLDQKQAPLGVPGMNAGELKIKAQTLVGDLFVRADGQRGGQGETGAKGSTGGKGGVGPDTFLYWGKPAQMPPGAHLYRGYYFICDPPRAPGMTGERGGQGDSGNPGKRGGNSAKVDIQIAQMEEGEVYFTNRPGQGGPGGFGGDGGEGGEGGPPGQIDWLSHASKMPEGADLNLFHQCQPRQGDTGPLGPFGAEGAEGEEGYQALFCLKLGDVQSGHCPR